MLKAEVATRWSGARRKGDGEKKNKRRAAIRM